MAHSRSTLVSCRLGLAFYLPLQNIFLTSLKNSHSRKKMLRMFSYCILITSSIDLVILVNKWNVTSSVRWFLLHCCINMLIAILCIPSVIHVLEAPQDIFRLQEPEEWLWSPSSKWPLALVNTLHIYHCVANFQLSADDWFHHLLFIPTLGFLGVYFPWGSLNNWFAFFLCGIPGGIDYLILALQKMNKVPTLNQKRISANLNVWVRAPGVLFGIALGYAAKDTCEAPLVAFWIQTIFTFVNVLYYAKASVINYTLHQVRQFVPSQDWKALKKIN